MSPALCFRILQHLEELGLLKKGQDTVLDPMGGIGITNICAGAMGYPSISVELEEKFVNLQKENKEYAERKLYKSLDWQMLKGDSRRLSDLLKGQGLKSVVSPPYESSLNNTAEQKGWDKLANDPTSSRYGRKSIPSVGAEYSDNPDNIGNLKDTPLKSIVSPPYDGESSTHNRDRQQDIERMIRKGMKVNPDSADAKVVEFDYGKTEGQIGNLKDTPLKSIVSPPYSEAQSGGGIAKKGYTGSKHSPTDLVGNRSYMPEVHGQSEGQIANLKDTPLKAITSPPYGIDKTSGGLNTMPPRDEKDQAGRSPNSPSQAGAKDGYGETEGQIEKAESYLEAMKRVYSEIALVSDCLTIVLKNPTRNGRIRRLDLDTAAILEASGWRIFCQHRALLFEELEQADMFTGSKKQVKGRLSFFKRLSYIKGQPVSSWEDILICVRKS